MTDINLHGTNDQILIGKASDILFEHEIQQYQLKPNHIYIIRINGNDYTDILSVISLNQEKAVRVVN